MTAVLTRILLIASLVIAVASAANGGEKISVQGAEIIGFGVFQIKRGKALHASGTTSRLLWQTVPTKFVAATTNVDARLHNTFGVIYRIKGIPQNAHTQVVLQLAHPRIRNSDSGETSSVETWVEPVFIGVPEFGCFTFDHPYELVAGRWTFRVSQGSKVLFEKGFDVRLRH